MNGNNGFENQVPVLLQAVKRALQTQAVRCCTEPSSIHYFSINGDRILELQRYGKLNNRHV